MGTYLDAPKASNTTILHYHQDYIGRNVNSNDDIVSIESRKNNYAGWAKLNIKFVIYQYSVVAQQHQQRRQTTV